MREKGWWVVVASFLEASPSEKTRQTGAMIARLAPCGFEPLNDASSKFSGFRPGFTTFVLGAYPTRKRAEQVKKAVSACAPSAYLRQGAYAGE